MATLSAAVFGAEPALPPMRSLADIHATLSRLGFESDINVPALRTLPTQDVKPWAECLAAMQARVGVS